MKASNIIPRLVTLITHKKPFLLTGSPGLGKTDLTVSATKTAGARLIISHPVVSDPTDYKGMPAVLSDGTAHFLPFGDLMELVTAKEPTVFFCDDVGQAPPSVQAALMQLFLCRRVNGHKVSDHVTFAAATNRRSDKAGVGTFITPLLDRFDQIYQLDFDLEDWITWAFRNGQPEQIIGFARWRPGLISDFKQPKDDLCKCPTPRSVAKLGELIKIGLDDLETYMSACGEGFATEFAAFVKTRGSMPDIEELIKNPDKAPVPDRPDVLYATCAAVAYRASKANLGACLAYAQRLTAEFNVLLAKDVVNKVPGADQTKEWTQWSCKNHKLLSV